MMVWATLVGPTPDVARRLPLLRSARQKDNRTH